MSPVSPKMTSGVLLVAFEKAAGTAREAESVRRREMEAEILRLERQRAYAYRRLNFMRRLVEAIQSAESEEAAAATGRTAVRAELGWQTDSDTRAETLSELSTVMRATFTCLAATETNPPADQVVKALGDFEAWYQTRFGQVFWVLFEQPVEELPLVER